MPSNFHVLPKIHKNPISTRPIVPGYAQITSNTSEFLVTKLQHAVKSLPWVINRQIDFVNYIERLQFVNQPDPILASFDVESMYTSINTEKALRVIKALLLKLKWNREEVAFYIDLLAWVMKNNYFQYNGKWHHQINGTAMGTSCAPQFANLYLGFFEMLAIEKSKLDPKTYRRYLDDSFAILQSEAEVTEFDKMLNGWTADLRFTFEVGKQSLNFLDLTVSFGSRFKNTKRLDMKLYTKPTNLHLYTDPNSNVPPAYRFSWIIGEQIRLCRNTTSRKQYLKSIAEFKANLSARGYSDEMTKRYFRVEYTEVNRNILLSSVGRKQPESKDGNIYVKHDLMWKSYKESVYSLCEMLRLKHQIELNLRVIVLRGKSIQDRCNVVNKGS